MDARYFNKVLPQSLNELYNILIGIWHSGAFGSVYDNMMLAATNLLAQRLKLLLEYYVAKSKYYEHYIQQLSINESRLFFCLPGYDVDDHRYREKYLNSTYSLIGLESHISYIVQLLIIQLNNNFYHAITDISPLVRSLYSCLRHYEITYKTLR